MHSKSTARFAAARDHFLYDGSESSFAQLYVYNSSYAAQGRSERNENLNSPRSQRSFLLCFLIVTPFLCIYRHAYEILSRYTNTNTDRYLSNNTNDHNESSSRYIIISPSMRMKFIGGSNRCTRNLLTMEEAAAVVPSDYSNRGFRDIILTLRRDRNDSIRQGSTLKESVKHMLYTCLPTTSFLFPHRAYGRVLRPVTPSFYQWPRSLRMELCRVESIVTIKSVTPSSYLVNSVQISQLLKI